MPSASPKALPATRPAVRASPTPAASRARPGAAISVHPLTDNPTTCTGKPLTTTLEVQTYQDPEQPLRSRSQLSGDHRLRERDLQTGPLRQPDHRRDRLRLGPQRRAERPAVRGLRRLALGDQIGHRDPARRASRSTPTPPTGRATCTDAQANFGSEGPAECPDNSKIGTFSIGSPTPQRAARRLRLHRRTEARRPVPPLHDRLGLRHQRQAGRLGQARPRNRPADRLLRRPAPGPLRRLPAAPLRRRPRPDGDPDVLHDLHASTPTSSPGTTRLPDQQSSQIFGLNSGPHGSRVPGPGPPLQPEPGRRHLQPRPPAPSAPSP